MVLATEPTVNVTVTVSGHAGTDLTLTSVKLVNDELTFTPDNWNAPQAITVTAAHDDDGVEDSVTLAHAAAGGEYNNVDSDLPVTVNDNDPLGIVISPLSPAGSGGGGAWPRATAPTTPSASGHRARLRRETVTVTITDDGDSDLSLSGPTLSSNVLTFTAADWNVPQTVTVTAAHDEDREDDEEVLTHTAAGGEYDPITFRRTCS